MTGLYIHVPLCISRCRYCDFYKLTPNEWDDITLYIRALEVELQRLPKTFRPDTVFIGGGTPTALEPENLAELFRVIRAHIDISRVGEYTSEANPGTLTPEKLAIMKEGGVNRVSMGVQSFNNKALRLLGRIHKADQAVEGFHLLREAGFTNVNIDLIQSIPGMSPEDILDDARHAASLGPDHISYYNLIYEPGTPMTRDRDTGKIIPPGEDEEADNYYAVKRLLEDSGYGHYEISNFCRPGRECLHNIIYWQGFSYFGCGPSAHSHWEGARYGNVPDLQAYCDRLLRGEGAFDDLERLAAEDKARETLVMWLRMMEGVELTEFKNRTGLEVEGLCGSAISSFMEEGLLQMEGNRLALAPDALFVSNSVFSDLV
jgi:oxygen-independent coproporphyrinogen-3 oxidase